MTEHEYMAIMKRLLLVAWVCLRFYRYQCGDWESCVALRRALSALDAAKEGE